MKWFLAASLVLNAVFGGWLILFSMDRGDEVKHLELLGKVNQRLGGSADVTAKSNYALNEKVINGRLDELRNDSILTRVLNNRRDE